MGPEIAVMKVSERVQRLLAFGAAGTVWLFACAVGIWIGVDVGHAAFG